jgi:hypothetical protein
MKKLTKFLLILSAAGPALFGMNCTTDLRDAALTGALDFVSGTITDGATALLPIADWMGAIWGG